MNKERGNADTTQPDNKKPDQRPGFPAFDDGKNNKRTVNDMQRRNHVVRKVYAEQKSVDRRVKRVLRQHSGETQFARKQHESRAGDERSPDQRLPQSPHVAGANEHRRQQKKHIHRQIKPDEFRHERQYQFHIQVNRMPGRKPGRVPIAQRVNQEKNQPDDPRLARKTGPVASSCESRHGLKFSVVCQIIANRYKGVLLQGDKENAHQGIFSFWTKYA